MMVAFMTAASTSPHSLVRRSLVALVAAGAFAGCSPTPVQRYLPVDAGLVGGNGGAGGSDAGASGSAAGTGGSGGGATGGSGGSGGDAGSGPGGSGGGPTGGSGGGTGGGAGNATGGSGGSVGTGPKDCATASPWRAGMYPPGAAVTNGSPLHLYECKPFPYDGWCGNPGYEPGKPGAPWTDAWIDLGPCP